MLTLVSCYSRPSCAHNNLILLLPMYNTFWYYYTAANTVPAMIMTAGTNDPTTVTDQESQATTTKLSIATLSSQVPLSTTMATIESDPTTLEIKGTKVY